MTAEKTAEATLDASDADELLSRLVEDFLERRRAGDHPASGEYCARYPEIAERIRHVFPALDLIEGARIGPRDFEDATRPDSESARPVELQELDTIGQYRIRREIGRGGMAVVYEAESASLGRTVALKVLPVGVSETSQAQRFRQEASAAARLHHTNIVPVFEVSEDGGRLFYAMQLVEGKSLREIIREVKSRDTSTESFSVIEVYPDRSRYCRAIASLGMQVADALAHSHERGVLHRDVKPSNLMLDESGAIWITDFGLAKATEQDDLTQTGDVIGTLRYMSPERFEGECDARADVYGLGLVLYEMLVLEPAVQPSENARLVETIRRQEPRALREIDPEVPVDLETIVRRAIDKDPGQRYGTAKELAEDLERFLDDRPIRARPISTIEKLVRWGKRNRDLAAALSLVVVLLVATTIASVFAMLRAKEGERREIAFSREKSELASRREREVYFADMLLAAYSSEESGALSRIEDKVARWRQPRGDVDHRGWEWYYLSSLSGLESKTLIVPRDSVFSLSWDPVHQQLAAAVGFREVRIWSTETWERVARFKVRNARLAEWSPNGEYLAVASKDDRIRMFRRNESQPNGVERVWNDQVSRHIDSIEWSSDGTMLLAATRKRAILYDAASGKKQWVVRPDEKLGLRVARFAGDGEHVLVSENGVEVALRRVADGSPVMTFQQRHSAGIYDIHCDPSGKRFASVDSRGEVYVWSLVNRSFLHAFWTEKSQPCSLRWSPSGRYIATPGHDESIKIWDAEYGRIERVLRGHRATALSVEWSPDEKQLVSAGDDATIKVWPLDVLGPHQSIANAHRRVLGVRFTPDGSGLISGGGRYGPESSPRIKLWKGSNNELVRSFAEGERRILSLDVSPDGKRLAAGSNRSELKIYDVASGKQLQHVEGVKGAVFGLSWSPNAEKLAVAQGDRPYLSLWDVRGEEPKRLPIGSRHEHRINAVSFHPQGHELATAGHDGTVRVIDPRTGEELAVFCSEHIAGKLRNRPASQILRTYPLPSNASTPLRPDHRSWSVVWSHGGRRLAWTSGRFLILRDMEANLGFSVLDGHASSIRSVAWSPNGSRIATGSNGGVIRLWSPADGACALALGGHLGHVHDLRWSPDSYKLAAACGDGTVRIFDATSGYAADR